MIKNRIYDIKEIQKLLPHRYPFLLVDRILEVTEEKLVALKNVTVNEEFFSGHFPGNPIMPGVLIMEALAQAGGLHCVISQEIEDTSNLQVFFMSMDEVKFRKPVVPGDALMLNVTPLQKRSTIWKIKGEATVNGEKVAEGILTAMIISKKEGENA